MKAIKLYFAGDWSAIEDTNRNKITCDVSNRLVSFAYPKLFKDWMAISNKEKGSIIVDSGAFSAWNKGSVIDITSYIEYSLKAIEEGKVSNKDIHIVNLDVIPGKAGETKNLQKFTNTANKDLINKAAKEGFTNLKKMVAANIKPIHVFHQGEEWKWLERMIQYTDYIGISPANDMPPASKKQWIHSVFTYLEKNSIDVKTHGFAVASTSLLRDFPWTSCDAASWRLSAATGSIYYPLGGFSSSDYTKMEVIYIANTKGNVIPKKIENILKKDGYSIESLQTFGARAMFNIRFFLGLEKHINEQKQNKDFLPRTTLNL